MNLFNPLSIFLLVTIPLYVLAFIFYEEPKQTVFIDCGGAESLYMEVSEKVIEYKKKGIELDCGDIKYDGDGCHYVICTN